MIKSELIALISTKQPHLQQKDVELAINCIIEILTNSVATSERVEIRGFGSFTTVVHDARIGRNPKTGEAVSIPSRHAIHFKPGLEMRSKVNESKHRYPVIKDL